MRRQLAHIPGAEFMVLSEAAHSINWEQPEAFNRNVLEFIRRHYRAAKIPICLVALNRLPKTAVRYEWICRVPCL